LKTVAPLFSNDANFWPGMACKWGLSFLINPEQTPQGRSAGSLAWAGLANTFYWIDPTKQVTGVFFTRFTAPLKQPLRASRCCPLLRPLDHPCGAQQQLPRHSAGTLSRAAGA